jgi:hypothetical protein
MEIFTTGILGSIFGGLFRLAPEILKFFDRKNERGHELKMFELQTDLEKIKGDYRMEEKYVDYSVANLSAIQSAFNEQSETASKSYKWVSALSALVRPVITYVLFGMYVAVKIAFIIAGLSSGSPWVTVLAANWTLEDFAMLNGIITFWFVGRTIEKYSK